MNSNLPIDNISVFVTKILGISKDEEGKFYDEHEDQAELAAQIIAIENAIYLMRRATGLDGSNIDKISNLRTELVSEYEQEFGEWPKDNSNEMW